MPYHVKGDVVSEKYFIWRARFNVGWSPILHGVHPGRMVIAAQMPASLGSWSMVEQFGDGLMRKEQRVASVGSSGGRCSGGEAQRRKGQLPGRK